MSVGNCTFPWHWMVITNDGDVLPCSHGSSSVGNLCQNTVEEIWNGSVLQEVRSCLLKGEVHRVCQSTECPFQHEHPAFPEPSESLVLDERFAHEFDEEWYRVAHPDVRDAVDIHRFTSGLEHFIRHGRREGRAYRLVAAKEAKPLNNAVLCLLEYTKKLTRLQAKPVDLVLAISTICNLRCVMCPHGMGLVENPHHMQVEIMHRAKSFLDSAFRIIVSGIGEPTLAPSFWWLIDQVRNREDVYIRINSNGHFLDVEKSQKILNSGLTEISFSIDAATAETYSKIRGGNFEKVLASISTLLRVRASHKNKRLAVYINMTLMRENVCEAAAFVTLGHRLGVDGIIFTQLFTFGARPDWNVHRGNWSFVYSEQMLHRMSDEAHKYIAEAKESSERIGIPVQLRDNVVSYLREIAIS